MLRRDGLKIIQEQITNEPVIANLGPSTFDLHSSGDRDANLYTWGAMGLVSSIGLGVAISAPQTKVIVTDGDGSLLMNLGSLATIARQSPKNLIHIVWDNQMWYETGGQATHTSTGTSLAGIAKASGIKNVLEVSTAEEFKAALTMALNNEGPWFIHAAVEELNEKRNRPEVMVEENLLRFRRVFLS